MPQFDTAVRNKIKKILSDSTLNIPYNPGYSYLNPFGPGSSFSLNGNLGQFSFKAVDTGRYFLCFRVEEYRDKKLLGDITVWRTVNVLDSNVTLPVITGPYNINGGSYDSVNKTIYLCPGENLQLSMKANSTLNDAQIVFTNNFSQACPGSTSNTSGQSINNVTTNFNWTPTAADGGYHYLFVDAVDTACGHVAVHQEEGFKIYVRQGIGISTSKTTICKGQSATLHGYGNGPYQWSVLPGGDPFLPCTVCDSITVSPAYTTSYIVSIPGTNCVIRDTLKLTVIPDFSLLSSKDSFFCTPITQGSQLTAAPIPPAGYYTWQWSPAGAVNNPTAANPGVVNPGAANTYYVQVSDSFGCFTHKDTIQWNSYNLSPAVSPAVDTFCPQEKIQLYASGGQLYTWAPAANLSCNNCNNPIASPKESVIYTVTITDTPSQCVFNRNIVLTHADFPDVNAGPDIIATGGPFQMNGSGAGSVFLGWAPRNPLENPWDLRTRGAVRETTLFTLTASDGVCSMTDTMMVFYEPCRDLNFPNVFTPDHTRGNDKFIYTNTEAIQVIKFQIYNRWGELVYLGLGPNIQGWDGSYLGVPQPQGVHVYQITIRCNNKETVRKGNVILMRG